jgi:hypothetical protein
LEGHPKGVSTAGPDFPYPQCPQFLLRSDTPWISSDRS